VGVTPVELLVVVVVLGVLAAVAVPNMSKFISHGDTEAIWKLGRQRKPIPPMWEK
jgi:Tfp pilus assembly protein FimT